MKRKFLSVILAAALSMNLAVGVSASDIDVMMIEDAPDDKIVSEDVESGISIDTEEDEKDSDVQVEENIDEESSEDAESDELDLSDSETTEFSDGAAEAGVTEHGTVGGYRPSAADYNVPVYDSGISTYSELPSSFPDDMDSFSQKYPAVRDQGSYGTCWAFASNGLAEFDLVNKSLCSKDVDLSELQLAYFTFNSVQDPLGGTEGDYAKYYNENAASNYLNYGGNYEMAARRMSQWVGSTAEADVPYEMASSVLENGLDEKYAYNYDVAHLKNAYIINMKSNADAVKENIMTHGAAGVAYYHDYNSMSWNREKKLWTYYDTGYSGGGHVVMAVGWDDNFSKDNFVGNKPANDGAWLVRNSWGFTQSYFWMSYESVSLSESAWFFDVNTINDEEYDNNYQLDGGLESWRNPYTTVSNVYTVSPKNGVASEILKAVSFSCMKTAGVSYSIDVYTDLQGNNPASGTLCTEAHTEGTTTYAGIYTIPLANEIELQAGSSFAVVINTDVPAVDYEQATQIVSGTDSTKVVWDCKISQLNGKSFYGKYFWNFPYYGNFCIKAFTTNNSYKITYELNGGENNADNPTAYGGNDVPIVLKDPTRGDGYAFDGWYLESDYQTRITEIPANASGEYTLYAKWVSATGEIAEGYSLNLDGNIAINMYMKLPDKLKENADAYMEFTLPNGTVSKVSVKDATVEKDCYVFTGKVAAKEMAKDVKVRMYADDTEYGKEYTVSVQNYANYILRNADTHSDTLVSLVKRMLNYGAASQEMFGYEVNNLANNILEDADKNVGTYEFNDYKYTYNHDGYLPVSWYGSSLLLESDTCVRDYFYLDGPSGIDAYSFKAIINNGTPIELTPIQKTLNGEDYYYVDIPNIKAQNLAQSIEVKVASKSQPETEILSLKYNAFSYAYSLACMSNPDQKNVKVMNAMYEYWRMAHQYVAEKNNSNS